MEIVVLHPNTSAIYGFLSLIHAQNSGNGRKEPGRILDCGAGGSLPPLALFGQLGFESCGIDNSADELAKAAQYCAQKGVAVSLQPGDMRHIPYPDGSFDNVYEHYSMCHLSKADSALAVSEMGRVLKPGGMCLLGVISTHTWPHSLFGEERKPGEFYGEEGGKQNVLHSMFSDAEAGELVAGWEIIVQEEQVRYMREAAAEASLEDWMLLLPEADPTCSEEAWRAKYKERLSWYRYNHLFYTLRKTA